MGSQRWTRFSVLRRPRHTQPQLPVAVVEDKEEAGSEVESAVRHAGVAAVSVRLHEIEQELALVESEVQEQRVVAEEKQYTAFSETEVELEDRCYSLAVDIKEEEEACERVCTLETARLADLRTEGCCLRGSSSSNSIINTDRPSRRQELKVELAEARECKVLMDESRVVRAKVESILAEARFLNSERLELQHSASDARHTVQATESEIEQLRAELSSMEADILPEIGYSCSQAASMQELWQLEEEAESTAQHVEKLEHALSLKQHTGTSGKEAQVRSLAVRRPGSLLGSASEHSERNVHISSPSIAAALPRTKVCASSIESPLGNATGSRSGSGDRSTRRLAAENGRLRMEVNALRGTLSQVEASSSSRDSGAMRAARLHFQMQPRGSQQFTAALCASHARLRGMMHEQLQSSRGFLETLRQEVADAELRLRREELCREASEEEFLAAESALVASKPGIAALSMPALRTRLRPMRPLGLSVE